MLTIVRVDSSKIVADNTNLLVTFESIHPFIDAEVPEQILSSKRDMSDLSALTYHVSMTEGRFFNNHKNPINCRRKLLIGVTETNIFLINVISAEPEKQLDTVVPSTEKTSREDRIQSLRLLLGSLRQQLDTAADMLESL